ncbi:mitochondrial import receptor subunit TOM22 homolog isoform X4 [Petromyzon marinus]|uniref:Mitochondrial import receptor subunit TOM22 homolog n=1 Tax=Petromyzon marinus TaxID=7757 RepID=A0AAJ7SMF1_PETMA|nr:mitochondrial import receptor subunit TOM22 homolog [Petromyzon marinus]
MAAEIQERRAIEAADVDENIDDDDDLDEDEMEESLWERLCALSEMFPPRLLSSFSSAQRSASSVTASLYTLGRSLLWVSTTSFMILVLPVVFETEKLQLEQQQLQQQRQILLGPSAGVSGGILPPPKT